MFLPPILGGTRAVLPGALLSLASCSRAPEALPGAGSAKPAVQAAVQAAPIRAPALEAAPSALAPDALAARSGWPSPEPRAFLPGRLRKLPAWGEDLRARLDPAKDGWPTEVVAVAVEERLRAVFEREPWCADAFTSGLAALGDEATSTTVLRPAELAERFEHAHLTVARAANLDPTLHPWSRLRELAAAWAADFAETREPRLDLHVDGVRALPGSRYETDVGLRLSARRGAGLLQQNVRWKATWEVPAPGEAGVPRLAELSVERFEELQSARLTLEERTEQVFAGTPRWDTELSCGSGEHHLREDRLTGQAYLGMHGLAIGDVDGDGLEDVYLPQPGGQPNQLFLHRPDGTVVENAEAAGVAYLDATGPALLCDLDGDGDLDLAAAIGAHVVLSWNDGRGHFTDGVVLVGPDAPEILGLAAADPDQDGDLDLYACRYVAGGVVGGAPTPYFHAENGARNLYWQNRGKRVFVEAAADVGLGQNNTRFSLAAIWEDYDEDGDVDLYVVNDFGRNNLYRNDGGRFTDVAVEAGAEDQAAGMGAACADVDLDGRIDLYVTNMHSPEGLRIASQPQFLAEQPEHRAAYLHHARGNTLLQNQGGGRYRDVTVEAGVAPGGWAWGAVFLDLDDDALPEIYVPNGFASAAREPDLASFFWRRVVGRSPRGAETSEEYLNAWDACRHFAMFGGHAWNGGERNFVYHNLGGLRFADASAVLGGDLQDDTRLAAPIDWDDDGRIDLLLRNRTGPRVRLLRNAATSGNRSLAIELAGTRGNRDAIGARVELEAGDKLLRQRVYSAQGYLCAPSRRLHFGLGRAEEAQKVVVRWPDGTREAFGTLAAGARYRLVEGAGRAERIDFRRELASSTIGPRDGVAGPRSVERFVLCDRMPLSPLELPSRKGPASTVGAQTADGLLLSVVQGGDPTSRASLEALAPRTRGRRHVVLATDGPETLASTQAWIDSLGLGTHSGAADRRFLQALEVVLIEVLGPFEKLPLPLHLGVDREGQLVLIHCGSSDPAAIAADLERVRSLGPGRSTDGLLGGFWVRPAARDLAMVAQIFHKIGRGDLARAYQALARPAGGGR